MRALAAALMFAGFVAFLEVPSVDVYAAEKVVEGETVVRGTVTAYTSDPAETDSTPTVTASGTMTRPGVAANNCLPFGTRITVAGKSYVVEDRMNAKYGCERYDLWTAEKADAREWGVRRLAVSIYHE